jgi:sugar phosphate isomerase/epimerase
MFKNFCPSMFGMAGHQSEIIELALTYGFAGIDMNIREFATRAQQKGMAYARRLLDSARLHIGTFALPLDWNVDDAAFQKELKTLPGYAECAASLGCQCTTAIVAPANDQRPYHENFEFHRLRFREICDVLKPSGIHLAVGFQAAECHRRDKAFQFIYDLDALAMLLNMVAMPNIGLLFDTWEVVAAGGSVESLRKLSVEQIAAVQVSEMPAESGDNAPDVESGRVNIGEFLSVLSEMGYHGPVTLKPLQTSLQSRRRDSAVKQAAESLDKAWRAAGLAGGRGPA